jgi:hypothetical protein
MILIADTTRALLASTRSALTQVGCMTRLQYAQQHFDAILLTKHQARLMRVISINLTPTTGQQLLSAPMVLTVLRTIVPNAQIVPRTDDPDVAEYAAQIGCLPALPMRTPLERVAAGAVMALCEPRPAPLAQNPYVRAILAQAAILLPAMLQLHESAERMRTIQHRQANREVGRTISVLDALAGNKQPA